MKYIVLVDGLYLWNIGFVGRFFTGKCSKTRNYNDAKRFSFNRASRLKEKFGYEMMTESEVQKMVKDSLNQKLLFSEISPAICAFTGSQFQLNTLIDIYFYIVDNQLSTTIFQIESPDGSGSYYKISPKSDLYLIAQEAMNQARLTKAT